MNTLSVRPMSAPSYPQQSQAAYSTYAPPPATQLSGFASDQLTLYNLRSAISGGTSAYFRGHEMHNTMRSLVEGGLSGIPTGLKDMAGTAGQLAGIGAFGAAIGASIRNGYGLATGKIEASEVGMNIAKDTVRGALAGVSGGTAAGLVGFIPVKGVMGTVLSVGAGMVGGVLGGKLAEKLNSNY